MSKKARLIPRKILSSDERVVFESRPSAWVYMKSAALAFIVMLAAMAVFAWPWIPGAPDLPYVTEAFEREDYGDILHWAFAGIAVLAMLYFIARWLRWSSTVYAATDERLIKQRGILNKVYEDIPVTMITNIDLAQSLGKRALGYGTMIFSTQGMGGKKADMVWEAVPDPLTVRRRIQEVMDTRSKPRM